MLTNQQTEWWCELTQEERFAIIIKAHRDLEQWNPQTNAVLKDARTNQTLSIMESQSAADVLPSTAIIR